VLDIGYTIIASAILAAAIIGSRIEWRLY